ncbi:MAG: DUF3108 domain-containing protein [Acidobacteriota bacterium]
MILRFCAATAIAVGAACLTSPTAIAAGTDARVPFQVGEALTYDVSFSNFVTAGRATMRVTDRKTLGAGRTGYGLQVEAQSLSVAASLYKLYYKIESVLDTTSLASVRSVSYSNEGGRERVKSISFGPNNTADVETRTKQSVRRKLTLPAHTLDMLSAIYVIRALAVRPGESLTMPIVDGESISRVRLTFGSKEVVSTSVGKLPGWKVTLAVLDERGSAAHAQRWALWLSDDAARKPLRFDAALPVGAITLTLAK